MSYRCKVSISPMRAEASDKAEMVSQMLYGERCEVLMKEEKFWKIRMSFDGYEGWIDPKHIILTEKPLETHTIDEAYGVYDVAEGKRMLSLGAEVPSNTKKNNHTSQKDFLIERAIDFLGVPYLWGGRSYFGIDCSGLCQVIYKAIGIALPRDAYAQAEVGRTLDFLSEIQAGDLAFFHNAEGKITHVGVMISPDEIIHAHGEVRKDILDAVGIYNAEQKKHTHTLAFVKRIIE